MNVKKIKFNSVLVILFLMSVIALMFSCRTPQQKHDRLIHKYGEELCSLDTFVIRDTILKEVKIPIPEYRDSFIIEHDTIIETKKIFLQKKGNKFSLNIKPDTITYRDTIPYEVKVPGPKIVEEHFNWWYLLVAFLVGMVIAYRFRP